VDGRVDPAGVINMRRRAYFDVLVYNGFERGASGLPDCRELMLFLNRLTIAGMPGTPTTRVVTTTS
jgi:hypothetical protein